MLRVVADTNIFISALMFGGLPGSFLDLALLRSILLVTSPELLDELDEKLRLKFEVSSKDAYDTGKDGRLRPGRDTECCS